MMRLHVSKGQEFRFSVPKGEITVRAVKEDKNDTEKYKKIKSQITELTQQE